MKRLILSLLIGLTFLGCSTDDDSSENILVLYNQTTCNDPWQSIENDSELVDKIKTYFESVNITVSNVKIDDKGTPQLCNACNCFTGNRIILKVNKNDLDSIKEYNFQEYK